MQDGLICRLFKKETVSFGDLISSVLVTLMWLFVIVAGSAAICVLGYMGLNMLQNAGLVNMLQNTGLVNLDLSVIFSYHIAIYEFVVGLVVLGAMIAIVTVFLLACESVYTFTKTITIAQCPRYKKP